MVREFASITAPQLPSAACVGGIDPGLTDEDNVMCRMRFWMVLGALCFLVHGCSTAPTESLGDFRETLYVEGFLRAGTPVDSVFVGTTMPLYDVYDRDASAVTDAQVTLEVDAVSHELVPLAGKPGYYHSPTLKVEGGKTYRLTVTTSLSTATAETTVPLPPSASASCSGRSAASCSATTATGSAASGCWC